MAQVRPRPVPEDAGASRTVERLGDPVADYVALWLALDVFHERGRLTEEGWTFLVEHLQRPLELRLLERAPATVEGALRALALANHLLGCVDGMAAPGERAWYQRLRDHLLATARATLERRLLDERESGIEVRP